MEYRNLLERPSKSVAIMFVMLLVFAIPGAVRQATGEEPVPDLSTPLGKQASEKLTAVEKEASRLRETGAKTQGDYLANQAQRLRDVLNGKNVPAKEGGAELHLVGIYSGSFPNGPRKYGVAAVSVEVIDRPVVLALCAYEPVRWDVRLVKGAKLQKIILSGYGDQILESEPEGVAIEKHTHKGADPNSFHVYKADTAEYPEAVKRLKEWTKLEVSTFRGEYEYHGEPIVIGANKSELVFKRVLHDLDPLYLEATAFERARQRQTLGSLHYQAIHWSLVQPFGAKGALAEFVAGGPIEATIRALPLGVNRIAIDPRGPKYYGLDGGRVVQIDPKANRSTPMEIEGDLPELSVPCGMAFDSKRHRLVVTSLGGIGYMYAYETDKKVWSLLGDMDNIDLQAFTYCAKADCFYGWGQRPARDELVIYQFDATGKKTRTIELSQRVASNPELGHLVPPQINAIDDTLVILSPPPRNPAARSAGSTMIYTVDAKTGNVIHSGSARLCVELRGIGAEELQQLLNSLRNAASADTEEAVRALAAGGDPAVLTLRAALPVVHAPDPNRVGALLTQLDSDQWKGRDAAAAELAGFGEIVAPDLKAALKGTPSPEARKQIEGVLNKLESLASTPDDLAAMDNDIRDVEQRLRIRAIRVLTLIGTPAAVECLRSIAYEPDGAFGSSQAKAALRKL